MEIIELILNELEGDGVNAISVVENPAIEVDFIALSKQEEVNFKAIDEEKRILMGPLLIPDKPIYRRDGDREYYIYFTKDTVQKASQVYLKSGNQSKSTIEHEGGLVEGVHLVESWIVEDSEKDKSSIYGFSLPVGTWFGTMKVENEDIWQNYVKTGKVKGFSIEGLFANKQQEPDEEVEAQKVLDQIAECLKSSFS